MHIKREDQRKKLVEAACALAAERGIAALRTRDIAAAAGVSVGTLHYCFETKERLLRALYEYLRADMRAALDGILYGEGAPPRSTATFTLARLHLLRTPTTAFRAWRAFTREALTDDAVRNIVRAHFAEMRAQFEDVLTREKASGELNAPVLANPRIAAAVLSSLYEGLVVQWTIDPDAFGLDEYADAIAAVVGADAEDWKEASERIGSRS